MSDLVGKGEDRFSCDLAHILCFRSPSAGSALGEAGKERRRVGGRKMFH